VREEDLRKAGRNIRLIVCDLDGTLLDSRKTISPENLAALRAAQEKGIFVTICSGRVHTMLETYSRRLALRGPLIASNGAVIFDTRTGGISRLNKADPDPVYRLLRFCQDRGMDHIAATSGGCWYSRGSQRIARFEQYNELAKTEGLPLIPLRPFGSDYREALEGDIYKALISGLSPEEQAETGEYIRSVNLSVTSSEKGLLDVSAPGVNKGEGVRLLGELLGVEKSGICVFGDYWNDIPMMEQAGLSVAMGNADETVKRRALTVTASNDEDGVARAIRRYILQ
jgi:Cof subfamily protein (haloacid dehalogenase superfamily)